VKSIINFHQNVGPVHGDGLVISAVSDEVVDGDLNLFALLQTVKRLLQLKHNQRIFLIHHLFFGYKIIIFDRYLLTKFLNAAFP